jgi:hypothetical protein
MSHPTKNEKPVVIPAPPSEAELRAKLAELEAKLRKSEEEKQAIKRDVESSFAGFESKLRKIEAERRQLARVTAGARRDLIDASGGARKSFKESFKYWTPEQLAAKERDEELEVELEQLYQTLVAVSLVDDSGLFGVGTPVGVNGDMCGVYYTTSYYTPTGEKTETRVHLIPYCHYAALRNSYTIKHRTQIGPNGKKIRVPRKVRPVIYVEMPTEEQMQRHNAALQSREMIVE